MKSKLQASIFRGRDHDALDHWSVEELRVSGTQKLLAAILICLSVGLFAALLFAIGLAAATSQDVSFFEFSNIVLLAGSAVLTALVVIAVI